MCFECCTVHGTIGCPARQSITYDWPLVVRVDEWGFCSAQSADYHLDVETGTRTALRDFDSEAELAWVADYEDGEPTVRDLGVYARGRRG